MDSLAKMPDDRYDGLLRRLAITIYGWNCEKIESLGGHNATPFDSLDVAIRKEYINLAENIFDQIDVYMDEDVDDYLDELVDDDDW